MSSRSARIGAVLALLVLAGSGAWWALQEGDPPPPADVAEVEDTGMTPDETEELMRAIGYVQQ